MLKIIYESIKENAKLEIFMSIVLLIAMTAIACNMDKVSKSQSNNQENKLVNSVFDGKMIVIDPGHGGKDPGKVAVNDAKEKDINLAVAIKLRKILMDENCQVVMTREGEEVLHNTEKFSKIRDLNRRCEIINTAFEKNDECIMISIHQNSFTTESVHGAQCFYYQRSEDSRQLADCIQNVLNEKINKNNLKKSKPNDSYYLLINSRCPGIIVECGFLSNREEAARLITDRYQEEIAEMIRDGLIRYFENN